MSSPPPPPTPSPTPAPTSSLPPSSSTQWVGTSFTIPASALQNGGSFTATVPYVVAPGVTETALIPINADMVDDAYGSFFGGAPTKSQDFIPCIFFLIVYALLVPFAIWRVWNRNSRCNLLWRPCIFILTRIIICSIRIAYCLQFDRSRGSSRILYRGQELLISISFLFLTQGVIELVVKYKWATLIHWYTREDHLRRFLGVFSNLLLILAFVCGMFASASTAPDARSERDMVRLIRATGVILPLIIVSFLLLISTYWLWRDYTGTFSDPYGISPGHRRLSSVVSIISPAMLVLVAAYRLVLLQSTPNNTFKLLEQLYDPTLKRHFYILQLGPEWISTALLVIFNWRRILRTDLSLPRPDMAQYSKLSVNDEDEDVDGGGGIEEGGQRMNKLKNESAAGAGVGNEAGEEMAYQQSQERFYHERMRKRNKHKGIVGFFVNRFSLTFHYY